MNPSTLPETGNQLEARAVIQEDPTQPRAGGEALSLPQSNYPFPPSSEEFTQLLVRCFVDARNGAIDLLTDEETARLSSGGHR